MHRNFITPVGRASYAHVWEKAEMPNGEMKYSLSVLFPKDDKEGIGLIKKAIISAATEFFGKDKSKWPKGLDNPLRDGDAKAEEDKKHALYKDHMYINTSTKNQPGVVGPNAKPLMDQDDFYSGCYCRVSVNFYGYKKAGNVGIGVGLNNVMKVKDGDRLDGRVDAEDEFSKFAVETEDEPKQPADGTEAELQDEDDFFSEG